MKTVGAERLNQYRLRIRLKQRELADLLGLTEQYVSKLLSGSRRPGLAIAMRIERQTGVPAEAWLDSPLSKPAKRKPRLVETPSLANEIR
jgi:transcriptional regulator with XRE-family HTH domain